MPKGIDSVLASLAQQPYRRNISNWKVIPPRAASFADYPPWLHERLVSVMNRRGIEQLYTHQREALDLIHDGNNVVIQTPTASGKTLCYNLPVLDTALRDPSSRALYLFPTKALAMDQMLELAKLAEPLDSSLITNTYDGDTPADVRRKIRQSGNVIVTNPDMLHAGILPHHTKWLSLFENLRYVVIDELHTYRGVFGSHLANVLRRLRRIANFYGADPTYILCSATIANPRELGASLLEQPVELVSQSGAPTAEKHFILYNTPLVQVNTGTRESYIMHARRLAAKFLEADVQTIVFSTARITTELLLRYLKDAVESSPDKRGLVRGYRGGYLPKQRREIERGLKDGSIRGVVSTSALELGIDIGNLDCCIIAGYPGSIASTWQQAGRAGRRQGKSVAVFLARNLPHDQYVVQHPEFLFEQSPEHARINPDNLLILLEHVKCACFELPFNKGERFGGEEMEELLGLLEDGGLVHRGEEKWYWMADSYPAQSVSLRSMTRDNFVIIEVSGQPAQRSGGVYGEGEPSEEYQAEKFEQKLTRSGTNRHRVIGEVDYSGAFYHIFPKAIYVHDGVQYQVEELDFENRKAYVRRGDFDFYTDAESKTTVNIIDIFDKGGSSFANPHSGEVHVASKVIGFKKIRYYTQENVGYGEVNLPEREMGTTAYWSRLSGRFLAELPFSLAETVSGLYGIKYALHSLAAFVLMCEVRDLGTSMGAMRGEQFLDHLPGPGDPLIEEFDGEFEPLLFIYDNYPGGIGFSDKLYALHSQLWEGVRQRVSDCPCKHGCPSCIGPTMEFTGPEGVVIPVRRRKAAALAILSQITE